MIEYHGKYRGHVAVCRCGWTQDGFEDTHDANLAYLDHLATAPHEHVVPDKPRLELADEDGDPAVAFGVILIGACLGLVALVTWAARTWGWRW